MYRDFRLFFFLFREELVLEKGVIIKVVIRWLYFYIFLWYWGKVGFLKKIK